MTPETKTMCTGMTVFLAVAATVKPTLTFQHLSPSLMLTVGTLNIFDRGTNAEIAIGYLKSRTPNKEDWPQK